MFVPSRSAIIAAEARKRARVVMPDAGSCGAVLACLDEGALAAFAEGIADDTARGRIEEHVAECGTCAVVLARVAAALPSYVAGSNATGGEIAVDQAVAQGTRVGRYVVEDLIGRGAMGTVYAARDPDLDRTIALKLLRSDAFSERARHEMRGRLLREAKAMARLSHPEVIAVHDVGSFGDQLFVAMEYVDGGTLRQWRHERHRSYDEVLAVYERAGSGLAAAHEAGLVHRDFKPDNVLVSRDGRVRVTDFGLARAVDAGASAGLAVAVANRDGGPTVTLTRSGTLLGTPAYMAPEQLRGLPADARSDVFSFCVSLYEALYGERPFGGRSVTDLQAAIERGELRAAPLMTRVPKWLRLELLRGLRTDPDARFPSMRELLNALRAGGARNRRRTTRVIAVVATGAVLALVLRGLVRREVLPSRYRAEARTATSAPSAPLRQIGDLSPGLAAQAWSPSSAREAITSSDRLDGSMPRARPGDWLPRAEVGSARRSTVNQPGVPPRDSAPGLPAAPRARPLVGNNGAFIIE
jgi:serine/threonine protein kinase